VTVLNIIYSSITLKTNKKEKIIFSISIYPFSKQRRLSSFRSNLFSECLNFGCKVWITHYFSLKSKGNTHVFQHVHCFLSSVNITKLLKVLLFIKRYTIYKVEQVFFCSTIVNPILFDLFSYRSRVRIYNYEFTVLTSDVKRVYVSCFCEHLYKLYLLKHVLL